ncbi:MAG: hypothetical protein ACO1SV_03375 [Fimbriimonas sp.]
MRDPSWIKETTSKGVVYTRYPRTMRMALAAGGAIMATLASLFLPANAFPVTFLGLATMAFALAVRQEVRLDARNRSYLSIDGLWPFMAVRSGPFEDFRRVYIDAQNTLGNSLGSAHSLTHTYYVTLHWGPDAPTLPLSVASTESFEFAAQSALELAEIVGAPVVEGREMRRLRSEIGPTIYDRCLMPAVEVPRTMET